MANRRQKRDNPDGVALSEWVFFGLLLIVPIACLVVYFFFARGCGISVHPESKYYCSVNETLAWLKNDGGWWKLSIVAAVIGLFTFLGREDDESAKKNSDGDLDKPD